MAHDSAVVEAKRPGSDTRLVYSTDGGRVKATPHNRKVEAPTRPSSSAGPVVPDDGVVRVARDKKGRGGKTATIVTGLPGTEAELESLAKRLKSSLGSGGGREGRTIVIQGDHRERLIAELTRLGHKPKLAGG